MKNKEVLFEALEAIYSIIADPIKPLNKEAWKAETCDRLQDKTDAEFDSYVATLTDIASFSLYFY